MTRSSSHDRAEPFLVDQPRALVNYLDALLREVPRVEEAGQRRGTVAKLAPPSSRSVPVEDQLPSPLDRAARSHRVAQDDAVLSTDVACDVPAWAAGGFQALIFLVGSLRLSVPLVKLHSVIPWSDKVTPTPNKTDWCWGLLRYRDKNVTVVDTVKLVLPAHKRNSAGAQAPPKHILIVGDGAWGLACHAIGEVLQLEPTAIKWRSDRGQRRWLAGTVVEHLCALLDTEAFAAMLAGAQ